MQGIIENAVDALKQRTQSDIMAWLGPAIGPKVYEVGEDVRAPLILHDLQAAYAFTALPQPGKWLADIYKLAKLRLRLAGVKHIYGGEFCTYTDSERFYSYRREGETGRMATLIWLSA
jgi:copper oxidase (laccase) domain-containing protein